MFLINQAMVDVPIGTAALIVVLGMAVVFFGLILLMLVTTVVMTWATVRRWMLRSGIRQLVRRARVVTCMSIQLPTSVCVKSLWVTHSVTCLARPRT